MLLSSVSFPLPPPPPLPLPPPLSALFTQSDHPYLFQAARLQTQHIHPPTYGLFITTKKFMQFACSSLLITLLVFLSQPRDSGSGNLTRNDAFDTRLYLNSNASDSQLAGAALASGGGSAPSPALTVGLLAALWVWVLDGLVPSLRVRGMRDDAARRVRDACRCRVCTLRIQARGQPLHDVSARGAGSKTLRRWSLAWHPWQAD